MKNLIKKVIVIWVIICTLLPTLFSGVANAVNEGYLNTERAGNYVANFAINFYENWSSNTVEVSKSTEGTRTTSSLLEAAQKFFDEILLGNSNIGYVAKSGRDSEKMVTDRSYCESDGIDCSAYVSACLWAAGYDEFASTVNTWDMEAACINGTYASYGLEVYRGDSDGSVLKYSEQYSGFILVNGATLYSILEPGDIIVVNFATENNGHTNIVKKVLSEGLQNKYLALDCGDASHWDTTYYNSKGGGCPYDIWTNVANWKGASSAYLIRVPKKNTSNVASGTKTHVRGEIKTEYDETVDPTAQVEEDIQDNYKFNNLSWISFAYSNALFQKDMTQVLSGSGNSSRLQSTTFNEKDSIDAIKASSASSDFVDVSTLTSEGKILPGDILYAEYPQYDTNGNIQYIQEYLLYVGGNKIIYATENERVNPSGALKYEYLEHYLQRIRRNLMEGHEDEENYVVPRFGITQVYRIKPEVSETISEKNANLIFNGKGYYSDVTYDGLPSKISFSEIRINPFRWLFDKLAQLIEFLINLAVYAIRMQIIGWANLFENLIQNVVLGITGNNENTSWDAVFGTNATSSSGERVTVESIFFNRIPILDANFFNFETAGGYSLLKTYNVMQTNSSGPTVVAPDDENVAYVLRRNLRSIYIVIRNLSIAILLFLLLIYGIKIAITSSAEKKAEFKKLLVSWVFALCVVFFVHFFMYAIFVVNDVFVNICKDIGETTARAAVNTQDEINLYDAVRMKAYVFNWREGVPATIIYVFMVYLMVRFLLIYLKRYLTIYILALSGSFMGVKYAIDRLMGKKVASLNKWAKDFAFNVLLQTVHAFIYILFMAVALSVSQTNLGGALIALVILNFMLKADQVIIKIFGLNKAGSLADVNSPESWKSLIHRMMPAYTITKGAINLGRGILFGERGIVTQASYMTTQAETIKDAKKEIENRKYNFIGGVARRINRTPIRHLFRYNDYTRRLGNNLSSDTNKKLYQAIKDAKRMQRQKFTRKISAVRDFTLGAGGMLASIAVGIADPVAGYALFRSSKGSWDKHRTLSRPQRHAERYGGTKARAKMEKIQAKREYNKLLDIHVRNEYNYEQKMAQLKDDLNKVNPNSSEAFTLIQAIEALEQVRKEDKAKELDQLREADEKMYETKVAFGNAKHEIGILNKAATVAGTVTGAGILANMADNDRKEAYKAKEDAKKSKSKLDDLAKIADLEQEVRELNKQLKTEEKRYIKDYASANNISEEESKKQLENGLKSSLAASIKEAKKMNVKTPYIVKAVNNYLYENAKTKITDDDVDGVLDKLKVVMNEAGKDIEITDDIKDKVKEYVKNKMIKDSKGLGFDSKDATTELRKALGEDGVMEPQSTSSIQDPKIRKLHEQIIRKISEINTYNEVGKVKYKDSLINLNKIIKDAKKQ